ncbi:MAG: PSD1 and planctomycete cytochrome C domain-containing protein [Verrucomicrobiales bacterium]|nr:PSD1 and planctomycete cytochrome C domain-containing protein [Verrucomicrobiales bacterium]
MAARLCLGLLFTFLPVSLSLSSDSEKISFNQKVRPILSDACFACHGFDEKERKADLRLDTPEGAYADLGGYRALIPGNLEKSEAWIRIICDDEDEIMPPRDFHKALKPEEKEILRKWIEQGAEYEEHWSFVTPKKPQLPESNTQKNPIDLFLQKRLTKESLVPAAEADKETLIRRVTLDLTGLPPTPMEVDAFFSDESPDAYGTLVAGLLKKVTYGEHMARYWLDLARYADTHGLHLDNERSMWPYRDWVVRALNQNLPFDDFTRWQLAGDLLPNPTREQLIASGFNRCNVTTSEGGSINEEWIYRYAVDRTTTTIEVWMGLTGGCAVCHDHKFDPLSAKDYYSMYSFFHSAADPAMDGNKIDTPPILKLTSPEEEERLKVLDTEIATVDKKIEKTVAGIEYVDPAKQSPPPPIRRTESIWFEDGFPKGAKPESSGGPLTLVKKGEGEVFSGNIALKRTAGAVVAQDFFAGGAEFPVPDKGTIFVHAFLDPANPPEAIMIQFHVGGWKHRAIWGAQEKIAFGKAGTTEKVHMGALPKRGEWVRLEVPAARLGLKKGSKIGGYAFTQFSGTVTWDRLGVSSETNPSVDPAWSWSKWIDMNQGKRNNDLPEGLRQLVRGKRADQWSEAETTQVKNFWLTNLYAGSQDLLAPLKAEKAPFEQEKMQIEKDAPTTFVMADLPEARESFVMERGQYDNPGEKVSRNVPAFLPPLPAKPKDRDYNRLDLANWLVSGENPLTARVTVNRFWQQFFGTGLVKTSEDFGSQGEPPSHPELLDWLAVQFVEDGWDIKKLVTRIVTSHAYRQRAAAGPALLEKDPENRLLARGPRLRLDGEVLRDQALFLSGLLVPTIGGKGVKPYQPENIWEPVGFGSSNTRYYKQDTGDALYRRSLYTFFKRTAPPPFLSSFDAPNREQSCSRRGRSNTPLQALQLMNDIQHVEAARNLAARVLTEGGASDQERIRWAWRTVTARWPEPDEEETVLNALTQHRNRYASDEVAAKELTSYGESETDPKLNRVDLAAYTLIANLLLNLDETVNKN